MNQHQESEQTALVPMHQPATCDWYRFGVGRCGERGSWTSHARTASDFDHRVVCTRHARKLAMWAYTEGCEHQLQFEHLSSGERLAASDIDVRIVRQTQVRQPSRSAAA